MLSFLKSRYAKILLLLLIINVLINILFFSLNNLLNSDFFANYFLLNDIFKHKIFFPPDNFLLKFPLYYLTTYLFGQNITNLEALIFLELIATFILFFASYLIFMKDIQIGKSKNSLIFFLPLLLLINQSPSFYNALAHSSQRNFEITALFFTLLIFQTKKIGGILFFFILTISFFNDPYFIFTFGIPLLFCYLIFYLIKKDINYLKSAFLIFSSILFSQIIQVFFLLSNKFYFYPFNGSLIEPIKIFFNIKRFSLGLLFMFNSYLLGDFDIYRYLKIISNFLILIMGMVGLFLLSKKSLGKNIFGLFIPLCAFFTICAYTFSSRAGSLPTNRYLIMIPFCLCFGLAIFLESINKTTKFKKTAIYLIIIFTLLLNLKSLMPFFQFIEIREKYPSNFHTIQTLRNENLKYGYSGYWHSAINTFLSEDQIKIRQITCKKGKILPMLWMASDFWYQSSYYEGPTFLLIDYQKKDKHFFNDCSREKIINQFGKPIKELTIKSSGFNHLLHSLTPEEIPDDGDLNLMIFNYNIASQMK